MDVTLYWFLYLWCLETKLQWRALYPPPFFSELVTTVQIFFPQEWLGRKKKPIWDFLDLSWYLLWWILTQVAMDICMLSQTPVCFHTQSLTQWPCTFPTNCPHHKSLNKYLTPAYKTPLDQRSLFWSTPTPAQVWTGLVYHVLFLPSLAWEKHGHS